MTEDEMRSWLEDQLWSVVRYAQMNERLLSQISLIAHLLSNLDKMEKHDPDLGPELLAAAVHLGEAQQALQRAHQFMNARLEVKREGP